MASTPPASGPFIVFATVTAKPGKGDELEKALQPVIANANSDAEPLTLTYRCARHGDVFRLFEEYKSKQGVAEHQKQEAYRALGKSGLAAGVKIEIFQEIPKL
ncbi:hypothetical protein JCM3775_005149 [Rhodotorula graminis]|uniref:ABM domain-containing protein n=1 Tax=Rhodotorula graminis (strain WP1) TaxID=578459 RepID=A0A0P9IS44_RHOGW|nr:uncharacterized protein RHOBADRAFT_47066 [Rhodotorula graminis WP1]KPV72223.1 hypothetical protein RHOBADRAFT_47066 [Rhodotorula graminis WP1]